VFVSERGEKSREKLRSTTNSSFPNSSSAGSKDPLLEVIYIFISQFLCSNDTTENQYDSIWHVQVTPPRVFSQPSASASILTAGHLTKHRCLETITTSHAPSTNLHQFHQTLSLGLKLTMKVERPVSVDQRSERSAVPSVGDEPPRLDSKTVQKAMTEGPPPAQPVGYQSLPAPEKFDGDLAFDREELLKPDSRMASQGPKVWQVKALQLKLSALEATIAVKGGVFTYDDFEV
jgi:hypothetical protein